jgi:hypothetical protein
VTSALVLRASVGILALFLFASQTTVALALPADDDTGNAGNIGVTVTDPDETPSPSASPSVGSHSGGGGGVGSIADPEPTPEPSESPVAEPGAAGIVVSGITTHPRSELNPFGGTVNTTISVTNHTAAAVSGTLSFRLMTPFGAQIGPTLKRDVNRLPPDQHRATNVNLPDVAQWPLVLVTAEFSPRPASSDGGPIVREAWVVTFPWLLLALLVLAIASVAILRLTRPEWFGRPRSQ